MKTLNMNEVQAVSGAANYVNAAEAFFNGAVTGGMVGFLISAATGTGFVAALQPAATWAISGGLVTTILR